jgi:hypothetical protein
MRRKITTALISLAMIVLGTIAIAPPANASSGGTFCFHRDDDSPFTNAPVSLELSADGSVWVSVLALQTDENGCSWYALSGDYTQYYVRVSVDWWTGPVGEFPLHYWATSTYALPGSQYDTLGNNVVYCASTSRSNPCTYSG